MLQKCCLSWTPTSGCKGYVVNPAQWRVSFTILEIQFLDQLCHLQCWLRVKSFSEELACIFGRVPTSKRQNKKKNICGIYRFHMNKLHCEAIAEEKNGVIFLYTQMEMAIHWESDELHLPDLSVTQCNVMVILGERFFSSVCPFFPWIFLVSQYNRVDRCFPCPCWQQGVFLHSLSLSILLILPRILLHPTKLDFISTARVFMSPTMFWNIFVGPICNFHSASFLEM